MATAEVLVVTPDPAFRCSIAFALESGGLNLALHQNIGEAFLSEQAGDAACAVVDEDAIEDWTQARQQFASFAKPVILLVGSLRSQANLPSPICLTKPFLGEPLIQAVWSVIAAQK